MRKNILFFLALFLSSAALWATSKPLNYHLKTTLTSSSSKEFQFKMEQDIELECTFTSISPIDQFPEKITLYFKSINATLSYQNQLVSLNTDNDEKDNIEFQLLKQLLHKPIEIEINRNLSFKNYSDHFKRLEQNPIAKNNFIHLDLLKQIVAMICTPLEPDLSTFTIHPTFVAPSSVIIHPTLLEQKEMNTLSAAQPFHHENRTPTQILQLDGHLQVECSWNPKKFYTQKYMLKQHATETGDHKLLIDPLTLDSQLILTLNDN